MAILIILVKIQTGDLEDLLHAVDFHPVAPFQDAAALLAIVATAVAFSAIHHTISLIDLSEVTMDRSRCILKL